MQLLTDFANFLLSQGNKPSLLTVKNYKADIRQFILWFEELFKSSFDPSKITLQLLYDYKNTRNLSRRSMERHTSSLRKFFGFLKTQKIISQDPFDEKCVSAGSQKKEDPWMIKNFKNFLYEYKKSNLTIKNYINDLNGFFSWLKQIALAEQNEESAGKKNLTKLLSFSVIQDYKQRLIAANFSPATINRKLSSLRSYLNWAKDQGLVFHEPTLSAPTLQLANIKSKTPSQADKMSSSKKEFYAPLSNFTTHLPKHKRIWHFIRYSRPSWYKKYHSYSFTHYLHFAIFTTISCAVGFGLYGHIFANGQKNKAVLGIYQEPIINTAGDKTHIFQTKDNNQTIEYGSVVCLDSSGLAVECSHDNNAIIGVASENPAFPGGKNSGNGSITVGLIGQVETLIAASNGEIRTGDVLTASDIPGVAKKATKAGQIIGKALENLINDETKLAGYFDPDNKEYRSKVNFPNISLKPNIVRIYKIPVLVSVSWHDPNAYFTQDGGLTINNNEYSIANSSDETLTNTGGFWKIIAVKIETGMVNASKIVTNALDIASDSITINGQSLKDYIVSAVENSGITKPDIISPLSSSDLTINNTAGSSVLSVSQTRDVVASGSDTFTKINLSLTQPVLPISETEVIASSSAGITAIAPYQSEVTINNVLVTDKSIIYITPIGTPSSQVPFLIRQIPQKSFTVGIQSPANRTTEFNWLIIN